MVRGKKSIFTICGIPVSSSKEDVKKAYRQQAKKLHPDKGGSEIAFNELREAWETYNSSSTTTVVKRRKRPVFGSSLFDILEV